MAIGGGKDSLVSIEALRGLGVAQTVTWIGGSQLIAACAHRTGLPIITEVMEPGDVPLVAAYSDILQIGARNMQNFPLLKEAGRSDPWRQ